MKRGAKKNKVLENMVVATVFFVIFSALVLATGTMNEIVFSNPTIPNIILYIAAIAVSLIFLILFLHAWEDIYESEGRSKE